jgi:hypothetical protein
MSEKHLTLTLPFVPEETSCIERTTVAHVDMLTQDLIPVGSPCYALKIKWNGRRKLIVGYVSSDTYHNIVKKL